MKANLQKVTLAFFSGTGCTKMVVNCFKRQFSELGIGVKIINIPFCSTDEIREIPNTELLVLFSPVYAFRLASIVEKWILTLPPAENTKAAVISVSGGGEISPNTACRVACKRLLNRKNYNVVYETMIVMPSNIFIPTKNELIARVLQILPAKVKAITYDLLSGRQHLTFPKVQDRLFSLAGRLEQYGAKIFGASIKVSDNCIACGLCIKNCPSRNITMKLGKITFGYNCILCLKCVYSCPNNAVSPGIIKPAVLKEGFNIEHLRQKAEQTLPYESFQCSKSFLWKGVINYLKD